MKMKKLESSLLNMVLVLVCVALIMGGLLAWVNNITSGPISQQAEKALADGIKQVMGGEKLTVVEEDTVRQTIDGKDLLSIRHRMDVNTTWGQPLKQQRWALAENSKCWWELILTERS